MEIETKKTWRELTIRLISGLIMMSLFSLIIYSGSVIWIVLLLYFLQFKCSQEILDICLNYLNVKSKRMVRRIKFANYFLLILMDYDILVREVLFEKYFSHVLTELGIDNRQQFILLFTLKYHRPIVFSLLIATIMFVLHSYCTIICNNNNKNSCQEKEEEKQKVCFLIAFQTCSLMASQGISGLVIASFEGLVWFLYPMLLVIFNDIMGYLFGKIIGRRPLIAVSPKKTVEGFIGSTITTNLFAILLAYLLVQSDFFTRPMHLVHTSQTAYFDSYAQQTFYTPRMYCWSLLELKPIYIHLAVISLFVSLIGPFGGFMMSGLKRTFHVKDFGALIPGHGGITDRFDCVYVVSQFMHYYCYTFVRQQSGPNQMLKEVMFNLDESERLNFMSLLKNLK